MNQTLQLQKGKCRLSCLGCLRDLFFRKAQNRSAKTSLYRTDVDVVRALGNTFQIKAVEAVPCALWIICISYREPEECLIRGVNMGGDADTVAAMIGDVVGALHGRKWIPARWYEHIEANSEENLGRGRDFAIDLAKKLATMDLNTILDDSD